jgi:multidrug efflux pump subunit AcrA (membrane-fusion protein)
MFRGDRQFVFVVRNDAGNADKEAGLVEITIGEGRDGRVIVTSGLNAGDQLIISGNRTLFDGALISKSGDTTGASEVRPY